MKGTAPRYLLIPLFPYSSISFILGHGDRRLGVVLVWCFAKSAFRDLFSQQRPSQ